MPVMGMARATRHVPITRRGESAAHRIDPTTPDVPAVPAVPAVVATANHCDELLNVHWEQLVRPPAW